MDDTSCLPNANGGNPKEEGVDGRVNADCKEPDLGEIWKGNSSIRNIFEMILTIREYFPSNNIRIIWITKS